MTSLLIKETEQYNAAIALLGSEDTETKGICELYDLTCNGRTRIADWAKNYIKVKYKTDVIRDTSDATQTTAGHIS